MLVDSLIVFLMFVSAKHSEGWMLTAVEGDGVFYMTVFEMK